jgi:hypothetical protein
MSLIYRDDLSLKFVHALFLEGRKMYYLTWFLQFTTLLLCNMGFILLGARALKVYIYIYLRMNYPTTIMHIYPPTLLLIF